MKLITTLFCLMLLLNSNAQTTVKLKINEFLGEESFAFNQESSNNLEDKFNVSRLQYYISNISIVHDTGKITPATGVYILVNAGNTTEFDLGEYDVADIEAINFSVGVNKPENHQDPTQWPNSHPLYPKSPSMHWGWTAGYRFVAMEGKAGASLSTTFQIHALGDYNYHKISIPTDAIEDNGDLIIELNADYAKAVENINIAQGVITHGDYDEAAELLRNFRDFVFSSSTGALNTLSLNEYSVNDFLNIYPNPSLSGDFVLRSENNGKINSYRIINSLGKVMQSNLEVNSTECSLAIKEKGIYYIEVLLITNKKVVKKVIVY